MNPELDRRATLVPDHGMLHILHLEASQDERDLKWSSLWQTVLRWNFAPDDNAVVLCMPPLDEGRASTGASVIVARLDPDEGTLNTVLVQRTISRKHNFDDAAERIATKYARHYMDSEDLDRMYVVATQEARFCVWLLTKGYDDDDDDDDDDVLHRLEEMDDVRRGREPSTRFVGAKESGSLHVWNACIDRIRSNPPKRAVHVPHSAAAPAPAPAGRHRQQQQQRQQWWA